MLTQNKCLVWIWTQYVQLFRPSNSQRTYRQTFSNNHIFEFRGPQNRYFQQKLKIDFGKITILFYIILFMVYVRECINVGLEKRVRRLYLSSTDGANMRQMRAARPCMFGRTVVWLRVSLRPSADCDTEPATRILFTNQYQYYPLQRSLLLLASA